MKPVIAKYILKHYKIISFDIFDTLVERNVRKPTDIFQITGEKVLGESHGQQFCENRMYAEKCARQKQINNEVTLEQIYNELVKVYESDIIEMLKKTEIQVELENCHKKETMFPFYQKCLEIGKRVFLISDMYLPQDVIEEMLRKCEIEHYQKLYISNRYGENKLSGELFQKVLNDNEIIPSEMIHIGDSVKADFLGARKKGIHSILIGRKNRFERLIH